MDISANLEHTIENPKVFILAGKAYFTIQNKETNNHLTYRINICKDNEKENKFYFVGVCSRYEGYSYIGNLYASKDETNYRFVPSKKIKNNPLSVKVFNVILDRYINKNNPHPNISFYHHNKCGKCGRTLTTPESIKSGIGPTCASR